MELKLEISEQTTDEILKVVRGYDLNDEAFLPDLRREIDALIVKAIDEYLEKAEKV